MESFKDLELAGWQAKAGAYDGLLATITDQAINPVLGSLGDLKRRRLLDVACGTGHLSGAATAAGAACIGIDFAGNMVELARRKFPEAAFTQGDAEHLPFESGTFDAVACAFGLLHLEHPQTAIEEAWRVLKPGGRYSYATWCGPDQGGSTLA
jgi:ubiquinone/menaquinone biosynthesis C-methylase UbiE